jgi:hypothetical protein
MAKIATWLGLGIFTIPSDAEKIPPQSAQDSLGWISTDWMIELSRWKALVWNEETDNGSVQWHWFAYKIDWTKIQFRKINTKIQYYDETTLAWVDIVTWLTSGAEYTFSPHQALSGSYMYANWPDGFYRIHTEFLTSYKDLYNEIINFKGKATIAWWRMLMWDLSNDKTGLYGSHLESLDYGLATNEDLWDGDWTNKTFSGTLLNGGTVISCFGLVIRWPVGASKTITAASKGVYCQITSAWHGFTNADRGKFVIIDDVVWMTELNEKAFKIFSTSTDEIVLDVDSSLFTTYTSGGVLSLAEEMIDDNKWWLTSVEWWTWTINNMTMEYSVTFKTAPINSLPVLADYSYDNPSNNGIADFVPDMGTWVRVPWSWFVVSQDEGGDPIQVVKYENGSYYSIKKNSIYQLTISADDTLWINKVFKNNIGMPNWQACVNTKDGIVFMDTANSWSPKLTILTPNALSDSLNPIALAEQFDFSKYSWDKCAMETYNEFIVFSWKKSWSDKNDRLFLYNFRNKTVDVLWYQADTIKQSEGMLYIWDATTENVYEVLSWFDDDNGTIENYWRSWNATFGTHDLKKQRSIEIKWIITPEQVLEVYFCPDNWWDTLIGTIRGDGSYVDYANNYTIGADWVGISALWWEENFIDWSWFLVRIKISQTKFRNRNIKLVAKWIWYVSIQQINDLKLMKFRNRLPKQYRTKQNVSKDGTQTDLANPA